MPSQVLITMDDLESAVPLNAALEASGISTAMFSALDDARGAVRRENPDLVILTGAVHEPHATQLAALARDAERGGLASRSSGGPARGCPHAKAAKRAGPGKKAGARSCGRGYFVRRSNGPPPGRGRRQV